MRGWSKWHQEKNSLLFLEVLNSEYGQNNEASSLSTHYPDSQGLCYKIY